MSTRHVRSHPEPASRRHSRTSVPQRRTSEATRISQTPMPLAPSAPRRRMEVIMSIKRAKTVGRARGVSPTAPETAAFSVPAFCRAHSLSPSLLYKMLRAGQGPRFMKCGARTLISMEAAQAWRRARERATAALRSAGGNSRKKPGRARAGRRRVGRVRQGCAGRSLLPNAHRRSGHHQGAGLPQHNSA